MNKNIDFSQFKSKIDFEPLKYTLTLSENGPSMSYDKMEIAIKWYERFLFLIYKYPNKVIVPTKLIDKVWHYHILDTKKYVGDCKKLFGSYLHHFPYLGERGEADVIALNKKFAESIALFKLHFGESPSELNSNAKSSVCGGGGGNCTRGGVYGSSNKPQLDGVDLVTRPTV